VPSLGPTTHTRTIYILLSAPPNKLPVHSPADMVENRRKEAKPLPLHIEGPVLHSPRSIQDDVLGGDKSEQKSGPYPQVPGKDHDPLDSENTPEEKPPETEGLCLENSVLLERKTLSDIRDKFLEERSNAASRSISPLSISPAATVSLIFDLIAHLNEWLEYYQQFQPVQVLNQLLQEAGFSQQALVQQWREAQGLLEGPPAVPDGSDLLPKPLESADIASDEELNESIWENWEWILSQAEELALKKSKEEHARIEKELQTLRKTAKQLRIRPLLITHAHHNLEKMGLISMRTLHAAVLDSSKRSSLLSAIINKHANDWLAFIRATFFQTSEEPADAPLPPPPSLACSIVASEIRAPTEPLAEHHEAPQPTTAEAQVEAPHSPEKEARNGTNTGQPAIAGDTTCKPAPSQPDTTASSPSNTPFQEYASQFFEGPYAKNTVGAMKEMAWMASHGSGKVGLSATVLGDITWSIWKVLTASISDTLGKPIPDTKGIALAEKLVEMQDDIIQIWDETTSNSRTGTEREGILPAKWKEEQIALRAKLKKIKEEGVDGKWEEPVKWTPADFYATIAQEATQEATQAKPNVKELTNLLEDRLHFHLPCPRSRAASRSSGTFNVAAGGS